VSARRQARAALLLGLCVAGCRGRAPADGAGDPQAEARRLATLPPGGTGPVDLAIATLEQEVAARPARIEPWIRLGQAWVRKARNASDPGFYGSARAAAEVALAIDPQAPEAAAAQNLQALALLDEHRFEAARALAAQILARHPDDLLALGSLSDALVELGRVPQAAAAVEKMMALKPNHPAYARASYLRWLAGDRERAIEYMRLAIDASDRRDPEPRAWALSQAAGYFWHQGDYRGADAGFDLALGAVPGYPPALVGKARVALAGDQPARAVALLERAAATSPVAETLWLLGDARAAAGDAAGAEAAYATLAKQARRSDPRTLALFYATHDREHEQAVALATQELATRGDIYTHDALAWALYRAGRLDEARAASDRATALGTDDARLLYHAGAIRMATGDARSGAALVRRALALNPRFDVTGAAEARRLLAAPGAH
jgi:tetratricopeptide (TPR) repeat protein